MIRTTVTRTSALVGFVPVGKLIHSYRSLLPALALCIAKAAWGQTTLGLRVPSGLRGTAQLAKPAAATRTSAQYDFITIKIPGSTFSYASNINDGRLVTGAYLDSSGNYWHGFLWRDGGVYTLDNAGSLDTELSGTNEQGVVIGVYSDFSTGHAATYSLASGTWTTLPDISGMSINYGMGINDFGVEVGIAGVGNLDSFSCSVNWIWDPGTSTYSSRALCSPLLQACSSSVISCGERPIGQPI